jgi:inner membrane protein YidH
MAMKDTEGARAHPLHLSDHLANERTFLAYLRTSVSLMSFGLAINRLSFFLEQVDQNSPRSALVGGQRLGIAMIVLAMALLVWASIYYSQVFHQIEAQDFRPTRRRIFVLAGFMLVAGLVAVVWLFLT